MAGAAPHGGLEPSPWILRFGASLPADATVLDVACGSGRHVRWLAGRGCRATGVDRDAPAVAALREVAEIVVGDIESGPWPFEGRCFDAVVVTNYLWRPLLPAILACVGPGGWLLYETFALGNETVGRPSNPAFLLRPGELLAATAGLRTVAYEDGFLTGPDRFVQRIAARRESPVGAAPARHVL